MEENATAILRTRLIVFRLRRHVSIMENIDCDWPDDLNYGVPQLPTLKPQSDPKDVDNFMTECGI